MATEKTTYIFNYVDKGKSGQEQTIRRFKKMDDAVDDFEDNYDKNSKKVNKNTSKMKQGVSELSSEFPLLGRAVRFATSPIGAFTIATAGAIGLMYKGVQASKSFNQQFLQLEQLNLDKSKEEIEGLRNSVLDLAFDKALDPEATSKAFFDIQSATGKYGDEVVKMVGITGEFSRAVQASFDAEINAVGVATNAYKLHGDQLESFLESSAKTVQVGVTTFDQLAQVQSEYAGAAAAAGQSFNEANKVFAVFSKSSKTVDIAATKTKGFFEDLSKLQKIDIDVFDDLGNFKKADKIIKDIDDKFSDLDAKTIDKLIDQVGGNEGLRGLLKSVAANGEAVIQTFEDFDSTEFSIGDAIATANDDLNIMNEQLDNKLQAAFVRLGDTALPLLTKIKGFFLDLIDSADEWMKKITFFANEKEYTRGKKKDNEASSDFILRQESNRFLGDDFAYFDEATQQKKLDQLIWYYQARQKHNKGKFDANGMLVNPDEDDGLGEIASTQGAHDYQLQKFANANAIDRALDVFETRDLNKIFDFLNPKIVDPNLTPESNLNLNGPSLPLETGGGSGGSSLSGVSVAGAKVRNVTVNINNLVKDILIQAQNTEIAIDELADKVSSVLVRSVRDAELTLSTE